MSARAKWIGGSIAVLALVGTGRLATNEVQLAGAQAKTRGLEQRAGGAVKDRYRLVRLEQELADQRHQAAELDEQRKAALEEVAALGSAVEAERARLAALRTKAADESQRMQASLDASEQRLAQREQSLSEARQLAAERTAALQEAQTLAADRQRDLLAARELAAERAAEVATRQAEVERQQATLKRKAREIDDLRGDLSSLRRSDERKGEVLERLESAGVNVARLSGERPMPRINAVVVGVDTEAVPPAVMLDVGRTSGIEVKDQLFLIRDGAVVARLEVTEVAAQVSSAKVIEGQRGLKLRPGEDVSSVEPQIPPP